MYAFTNDELRRLSAEELSLLEEKSQSGDNMAQWQMAMAILYGQANSRSIDDIARLLTTAISQENANALLYLHQNVEDHLQQPPLELSPLAAKPQDFDKLCRGLYLAIFFLPRYIYSLLLDEYW